MLEVQKRQAQDLPYWLNAVRLHSKFGVNLCSAFTGSQGPGKREWARAAGTMGAREWAGPSEEVGSRTGAELGEDHR